MFRLWGKMWENNHLIRDIVIDDDSEDTRTHKIFVHYRKSAMNLTWRTRSGLTTILLILSATPELGLTRTVL